MISIELLAVTFWNKLAQANPSLKESGARGKEIGRGELGKEGKAKEEMMIKNKC